MSFSVAAINRAVAAAVPEREALVFRDRRLTFGEVDERTDRLANVLLSHGITVHAERDRLERWECGQDRVALYLFNGNEYLEGMLGAFKARAVPFNVNYRYVAGELRHLLADSGARALVYHRRFGPVVREALAEREALVLCLAVEDGSGEPLVPGAAEYERALARASSEAPALECSADDIYLLYTGGTTGKPKGVLWRQGDSVIAQLAGRGRDGEALTSLGAFAQRAVESGGRRVLPAAPFMHGAGCYAALAAWHGGNTVVVQSEVERLDAADLLATIERESVNLVLLIGDAFARPVLAELESGGRRYRLDSVKIVYNSGAVLSEPLKERLLAHLPGARIVDGLGSSETGPQALSSTRPGAAGGRFRLTGEAVVLAEDRRTVLAAGHDGLGWLAKRGSVPLGYLGDRDRTEETFPVIDGERHVVSGDRVRLLASAEIDYHGRDAFTINSGGEKIFVEEVEQALKHHPDVADVVVTGRPSPRWGSEVVAIVQPAAPGRVDRDGLLAEAARHLARYKLPKAILFVPRVRRGDNGKADYVWARRLAAGQNPE